MTKDSIFSVIIPTFNRPEILVRTLDCIENQESFLSYEVIVVDDCSITPLPDLGFGKGKRTHWKLLRNEKNLGRAATRNRGIKEAQGEFILMIDDDIWAVPELLQVHYEAQQRIGGGVVIGAVPPSPEISDSVWHRYLRRRYERISKRLKAGDLDYGLFFTGNVSLPADALQKAGGFNEAFRDYSFEDTELGLRLYCSGITFTHAPDAVGYHFFEENMESISKKAFQKGRSAGVFVMLHPEEGRRINYHSITMGEWRKKEFLKNILKMLLFNRPFLIAVRSAVSFGSMVGSERIVFTALPWLEFCLMAKGAREAYLAGGTEIECVRIDK